MAIDALAARFGGTAYAAVEIAKALTRHADVSRVCVVTRPDAIVERGLRSRVGVTVLTVRPPGRAELVQRLAWEAVRLDGALERWGSTGLLSMSGMLPRVPNVPFVSLQANPTPYEDGDQLANRIRRRASRHASRHAAATFVPSHHVAELVGEVPRVRVVPLGVDAAHFEPSAGDANELLCVSDFYAHKQHALVLAAYASLRRPRPPLRLIGNPDVDPVNFRRIADLAKTIDGVVMSGRVSFGDLIEAYGRARAMLIASDRESFSMPVAEALTCGVPIVARDHPTLRETAGPGALFVAGDDANAWTEAIRRMISDDELHGRLRCAGLEHSRRYSWDAYAARLLRALSVLPGGPASVTHTGLTPLASFDDPARPG